MIWRFSNISHEPAKCCGADGCAVAKSSDWLRLKHALQGVELYNTFSVSDSCGFSHFNTNLHSEPKAGAGALVIKMRAWGES